MPPTLVVRAFTATLPCIGIALCFAADAQEKSWTQQPIRLVVSVTAGGPTDAVARALAEQLTHDLDTPVVVENRPGGNTTIAASAVANAPPDGSVLLFTSSGVSLNAALRPNIPNLLPQLTPVSLVMEAPMALGVSTALKAPTLKEFVNAANANPDKLSYGSHGVGSVAHIYGEILNREAGIKLIHVPFRGGAQSFPEVLAGRVTSVWGAPAQFKQYEEQGKIKALAVTGARRSANAPHVPTFEEFGYRNLTQNGWLGVLAPVATPYPLVERIAIALKNAVDKPPVRKTIRDLGYEPFSSTPAEFSTRIEQERLVWPTLVKGLNIVFE